VNAAATRFREMENERRRSQPEGRKVLQGLLDLLLRNQKDSQRGQWRLRQLDVDRHRYISLYVSQPTLWRLHSTKPVKEVQWQTYMALVHHAATFGVGTGRAWRASVYSPLARRAFDRYYACVGRELRRIDPDGRRLSALERRLKEWDSGSRSAWSEVQRFKRWLALHHPTRGATRIRHRYGLARALEPLLCAEDFGGMEVTADELHKSGKLDAYVRAALARERILMSRATDEQRAQQLPLPSDM
jgi:hypothetical protein